MSIDPRDPEKNVIGRSRACAGEGWGHPADNDRLLTETIRIRSSRARSLSVQIYGVHGVRQVQPHSIRVYLLQYMNGVRWSDRSKHAPRSIRSIYTPVGTEVNKYK